VFLLPKNFKLCGFLLLDFWVYLVKDILDTRRSPQIKYQGLYFNVLAFEA
jgi:hypothetical protein